MNHYPYLFIFLGFYILGVLFLYKLPRKRELSEKFITIAEAVMFAGIVYICLAASTYEAIGDSAYVNNIITRLLTKPWVGFYDSHGITYPPLFNYLYYLVGILCNALSIPITWQSKSFILMTKIPNLICIMLMCFLIYKTATNIKKENQLLVFFMVLYQPAYILAGVLVLQFDAIYTFFMCLCVYLLYSDHIKLSYFAFACAIMFKYQALFISPLILWVTVDKIILHDFNRKKFFTHLSAGLCAIGCMVFTFIPFILNPFGKSVDIAEDTNVTSNFAANLSGYGRASTNGYNFWALIGYNMEYDSNTFGPFKISIWGNIFLIVLIILSGIIYFKCKGAKRIYPVVAAFMTSGIFCFETKMMARYLYPTIILLVFAYAVYPTVKRLIASLLFSGAFFINLMYDFFILPYGKAYDHTRPDTYIFSAFMLFCFGYLCYMSGNEIKDCAIE